MSSAQGQQVGAVAEVMTCCSRQTKLPSKLERGEGLRERSHRRALSQRGGKRPTSGLGVSRVQPFDGPARWPAMSALGESRHGLGPGEAVRDPKRSWPPCLCRGAPWLLAPFPLGKIFLAGRRGRPGWCLVITLQIGYQNCRTGRPPTFAEVCVRSASSKIR